MTPFRQKPPDLTLATNLSSASCMIEVEAVRFFVMKSVGFSIVGAAFLAVDLGDEEAAWATGFLGFGARATGVG